MAAWVALQARSGEAAAERGQPGATRPEARGPGLQRRLGNRVVQRMLAPRSSAGAPVDADIRGRVEAATGASLAGVRVHTAGESQAAARGLGARAYTLGHDIHFGPGEYRPGSVEGDRLIAHELVHTIQQGGGVAAPQAKLAVSRPGDAGEREADTIADAVVAGGPVAATPVRARTGPLVQRKIFVGDRLNPERMTVTPMGPAPPEVDPLEILPPLANAGVGARNVQAMAADSRCRYFTDRQELEDFVALRTEDIGYVDREKTWVRLPEFLVLGEKHSATTLQDLVDATGTRKFQYEGRAELTTIPRAQGAPVDRADHTLEPELPKLVIGLHGVRDLFNTKPKNVYFTPLESARRQLDTPEQKREWKRLQREAAAEDQRREVKTPAQKQQDYAEELATWSSTWETDFTTAQQRIQARADNPSTTSTLTRGATTRPYDRSETEKYFALEALKYLQNRPYFSGGLRNFYKAHSAIVDATVRELGRNVDLLHTTMFRKVATGKFDLDLLIARFEHHAEALFTASGVRDASAVDGYAQNYERAGGNDANNDHGLRMEQMRDSYMLAKILAAQANGMRVFGLGDNHRKNLAAIVLAAHNDWVVCDAGTFYRQQYIMHPDRDL